MTIFVVITPSLNAALAAKIEAVYPNDHFKVAENQFLISDNATAIEVSTKLGIADPKNLYAPTVGTAVVFATSSYYGRSPSAVWDWIKTKLAPNNG